MDNGSIPAPGCGPTSPGLESHASWWRRRGLSLRALMLVVLLIGSSLGWLAYRARVQRDAVAAIRRIGGSVLYDWQVADDKSWPVEKRQAGWRAWLAARIGPDYFDHVQRVYIEGHKVQAGIDPVEVMSQIGRLSRVDCLYLRSIPITDAGLAAVGGLRRLETLQLGHTPITDVGMRNLSGLSGLVGLYLRGNRITDAALANLAGMTRLEQLDLSGTLITDAGLARVGVLSSLLDLELARTGITDAGLVHLVGLHRLDMLNLARTRITDEGLKTLSSMKNLTILFIDDTRVTDAAITALEKANPRLKVCR
jgi:hypothetical protein